jgi:hypothetical protein
MKQLSVNSIQYGLGNLKALCGAGWFALGNVLLLIGGDDTVEINFMPKGVPLAGSEFFSADPRHSIEGERQ